MNMELVPEELVSDSGVDRSPGLHLTDIIDDLLATLGIDQYGTPLDEQTRQTYFEGGFIGERFIEEQLSRLYGERAPERLGEIEKDGILGSPDGREHDGRVAEYKFTRKSASKTPDQNIRWMMQIKGYCWMCGTLGAVLRGIYYNGNYRDIGHPLPLRYDFTFTKRELQENWISILNHARGKKWLK